MTDTNQEVRETPELLPCPFCAGGAQVLEASGTFYALCVNADCFCCVGECYDRSAMPEHMFRTEQEAASAWNRRATLASAPPPAVPDAVGVRVSGIDARFEAWVFQMLVGHDEAMEKHTNEEDQFDERRDTARQIVTEIHRLSSIEPTPSPEPQASNAGAVDYSELVSIADEMYAPVHAALSPPGPQTGERDGELLNLRASLRNSVQAHMKALAERDAERTARETAERRLAEVEERVRNAEPAMWRRRGKHRWFYRESAPTSQSGSGWLPLYDQYVLAALRAKPEAQAIVGKEAGE